MRFLLIALVTTLNSTTAGLAQDCDATCLEQVKSYQEWLENKKAGEEPSKPTAISGISVEGFYDFNTDDLFAEPIKKGYKERQTEIIEELGGQ